MPTVNKRYRLQRIHGFSRVNRVLRLIRICMGLLAHRQRLGFQGRIAAGTDTHKQAPAIPRFGRYVYGSKASILPCVRGFVGDGVLVANVTGDSFADRIDPRGIFPPDAELFNMGVLFHKSLPVAEPDGQPASLHVVARHSAGEGRPCLLSFTPIKSNCGFSALGTAEIRRPKRLHCASL